METGFENVRRGRRRSLLAGLVLILFISSVEFVTDCFDYSRLSTTREGIRRSPHFDSIKFSQERSLNEIEDNQNGIRLRMGTHAAIFFIALWCLLDAVRIYALVIQPIHQDKAERGHAWLRCEVATHEQEQMMQKPEMLLARLRQFLHRLNA